MLMAKPVRPDRVALGRLLLLVDLRPGLTIPEIAEALGPEIRSRLLGLLAHAFGRGYCRSEEGGIYPEWSHPCNHDRP